MEDFDRSICLINKLRNTLKSLNFVDVKFEQLFFVKLASVTGLQLTSLKFHDVDNNFDTDLEFCLVSLRLCFTILKL